MLLVGHISNVPDPVERHVKNVPHKATWSYQYEPP